MLITTYSPEPHLNIKFRPQPITKVKKVLKIYKENNIIRNHTTPHIFIDTYA